MELDETDIRIIEQLNRKGRISLRKLSSKLDKSASTVSNRFHKLKEEGVIKTFIPVLDYEKLGFNFTTIIQIRTISGYQDKVSQNLSEKGYIQTLYQVTGETDIIAICKFPNRKQMKEQLTQDINKLEGVTDTNTNVVLEETVENRPIRLSGI